MKKLSTEEFITKCRKIHGNKYDYSLVNYKNQDTKVEIVCPIHGIFLQRPDHHLAGHECKKCSCNSEKILEQRDKMYEDFIIKSKIIHSNKYDYSKVIYKNARTKVCIICPEHGEFWVTPDSHLKGHNCLKCSIIENANNHRDNTEDFVSKSKLIHGNKYDYSKCVYIGNKLPVEIVCRKHGSFWQLPYNHLMKKGCPFCVDLSNSSGEKTIEKFLKDNSIEYKRQKTFIDCINPITNHKLRFDFYIPKLNICIEYDGRQHFYPVKKWGGYNALLTCIQRDNVKDNYCKDKNIKLIRISYKENILLKLNKLI